MRSERRILSSLSLLHIHIVLGWLLFGSFENVSGRDYISVFVPISKPGRYHRIVPVDQTSDGSPSYRGIDPRRMHYSIPREWLSKGRRGIGLMQSGQLLSDATSKVPQRVCHLLKVEKGKYVFAITKPHRAGFGQFAAWMKKGKIHALIASVHEFSAAPEAFTRLKTGRAGGEAVVRVTGIGILEA